jgi:hypothetical protein
LNADSRHAAARPSAAARATADNFPPHGRAPRGRWCHRSWQRRVTATVRRGHRRAARLRRSRTSGRGCAAHSGCRLRPPAGTTGRPPYRSRPLHYRRRKMTARSFCASAWPCAAAWRYHRTASARLSQRRRQWRTGDQPRTAPRHGPRLQPFRYQRAARLDILARALAGLVGHAEVVLRRGHPLFGGSVNQRTAAAVSCVSPPPPSRYMSPRLYCARAIPCSAARLVPSHGLGSVPRHPFAGVVQRGQLKTGPHDVPVRPRGSVPFGGRASSSGTPSPPS